MRRGFTLVELSIVLVIIGLLIGGILAAASMVETAKQQKIIKFVNEYGIAVNLFQERYRGLPGDSSKIVGPVSAYNGDDNGMIDSPGGINENVTFFQDLYAGGIIQTPYKPQSHWQDCGRETHPAVEGLAKDTSYRDSSCDDNDMTPSMTTHYSNAHSVYGGVNQAVTDNYFKIRVSGYISQNSYGAMHAKTAAGIDCKMDDCRSNSGGIVGFNPDWTPNIATVQPCRSNSVNGQYVTDYPTEGCALNIRICRAQGIC